MTKYDVKTTVLDAVDNDFLERLQKLQEILLWANNMF